MFIASWLMNPVVGLANIIQAKAVNSPGMKNGIGITISMNPLKGTSVLVTSQARITPQITAKPVLAVEMKILFPST